MLPIPQVTSTLVELSMQHFLSACIEPCAHDSCYEAAPTAGAGRHGMCCHDIVCYCCFNRLNARCPNIIRHCTYVTLLQIGGNSTFPRTALTAHISKSFKPKSKNPDLIFPDLGHTVVHKRKIADLNSTDVQRSTCWRFASQ